MLIKVVANYAGDTHVLTFADKACLFQLIEAKWRTNVSANYAIIGPDNSLSPDRRQAIIWTNDGILLIGHLGTNFNEILIGSHTFSFKNIHLKIPSGKWLPICFGLNVLTDIAFDSDTGESVGNTVRHDFFNGNRLGSIKLH